MTEFNVFKNIFLDVSGDGSRTRGSHRVYEYDSVLGSQSYNRQVTRRWIGTHKARYDRATQAFRFEPSSPPETHLSKNNGAVCATAEVDK